MILMPIHNTVARSVAERMEEVAGLSTKTDTKWREHVVLWWRAYSDNKEVEKEEMESLSSALLEP